VIGESHAAIHTWPEHGYAWVELATCGDPGALDIFADLMGKLSAELPT
jgi:S-adenosylmethionine/arginine decarboxylase-like enzyme